MLPVVNLSKSRFQTGLQCHRLLWLRVHEPTAPELAIDPRLQASFARGQHIGELARAEFPGGILIPNDDRRVDATRQAIADGVSTLFEASFASADVLVSVDVLERETNSWRLIEVKSTTSVKPQHITDAAVQAYVLSSAGLDVTHVEIMHLNAACSHPNLRDLFMREDITAEVAKVSPTLPHTIERQLTMVC